MSIRRNTAYNLIGSIAPLAVSLVTVPIYLALIGEARYGVLAVAWMLLGYFGLFDLGLGRATAQRIAALRNGAVSERAQAFWTALGLNIGLGVLGGLIIWPVADIFLGKVFKIDDAMRFEALAVVPWLILAVPMATLSGVLTGALQGCERFFELNLISGASSVLFQLIPLLVAKFWGVELGFLLPAALFVRLLTVFVLYGYCRRYVFCNHTASFVRSEAGQLLRFGGWVTVTSLVSPMMIILDRFIIGALLGAKAVSYYTVPFQLADRTGIIPFALSSALFPRFVGAPREEEQSLANRSLRVVVSVMTPIMATGIVLMEPFLSWWITSAFAREAGLVGRILLLGFWINALAVIPYAQLQAKGRPDIVAKCNLLELLPYFWMLYIALNSLGLVGAAVAFSVRIFADFVLLSGFSGILRQSLRLLVTPVLLLTTIFWISNNISFGSGEWFALVIVHLSFTVAWAWRQAPAELRSLVLIRFWNIVR
jgi:O-antigen/teichoic acid export membrane protein